MKDTWKSEGRCSVQSPMMCVVLRKKEKILRLFLEYDVDNIESLQDTSNCLLLRAARSGFHEGVYLLLSYGFNDLDMQKRTVPDRDDEPEEEEEARSSDSQNEEEDRKDDDSELKQFETLVAEDPKLKRAVNEGVQSFRKPKMAQLALATKFDRRSSFGQLTEHPCFEKHVVNEILKMMSNKKALLLKL